MNLARTKNFTAQVETVLRESSRRLGVLFKKKRFKIVKTKKILAR